MLTHFLLPWLSDLRLDAVTATDQFITLDVSAVQTTASCPCCHQPSHAIHSRYTRTLADLSWASHSVRVCVHVRKFFCRNAACARRIFTERLPQLAPSYARRTARLAAEQRQLALEQGGEAAARTAKRQAMPCSPRTLLRLARRIPVATVPSPRIVGVDDFAFRKGHTYGTLIVDLQRHQPIALLADRSAHTLACWLSEHPSIEIITRDRALDYADGAARGAPQALQVADRFHLLQNVREVVQRVLERNQSALRAALTSAVSEPVTIATPSPLPSSMPNIPAQQLASSSLIRTERERQQRRNARLTRYNDVQALHQKAHSIRAIADELHLSRQTVRRFLNADVFPEIGERKRRGSKLDPFISYLQAQLSAGHTNGLALWRVLHAEHGYCGSRALVSAWIARHRHHSPETSHLPRPRGRPPVSRSAVRAPSRKMSARQMSWLLFQPSNALSTDDECLVKRLQQQSGDVQQSYPLIQEFLRMVRERHRDALDGWLARVEKSNVVELRSFGAGLRRDYRAVAAALSLPFSNGQVEGQINRLKLIKRSGYGRAKFDLLRQRVLAA